MATTWNAKKICKEFGDLYKLLDTIDTEDKAEITRVKLKIMCLQALSSSYKNLVIEERQEQLEIAHSELMEKYNSNNRG